MLNMPIFATSPAATSPREDLHSTPAENTVTPTTQPQSEPGDWKVLEELGLDLLKMPTDGNDWMEGPLVGSQEYEMPFAIQPYGTIGLDSWS